jgi:hypothetical protein
LKNLKAKLKAKSLSKNIKAKSLDFAFFSQQFIYLINIC